MLEPVTRLDRHRVDEVPRFGAAEDGEHLVDGELLAAQGRSRSSRLDGEEPGVGGEIELGTVAVSRDEESGESGVDLDALDGEAGCLERVLCSRNQPVDSLTGESEEVEVARLALDTPARDQRRPTGEREPVRLVQARG